jgi:hypothetical protein
MCSFCTRLIDLDAAADRDRRRRAPSGRQPRRRRPEAHCRSMVVPARHRQPARPFATFITMVPCCIARPSPVSTSPGAMPAFHRFGHQEAGQGRTVGVAERAAIGLADASAGGGNEDYCVSCHVPLCLGGRVELCVA